MSKRIAMGRQEPKGLSKPKKLKREVLLINNLRKRLRIDKKGFAPRTIANLINPKEILEKCKYNVKSAESQAITSMANQLSASALISTSKRTGIGEATLKRLRRAINNYRLTEYTNSVLIRLYRLLSLDYREKSLEVVESCRKLRERAIEFDKAKRKEYALPKRTPVEYDNFDVGKNCRQEYQESR